MNRPYVICHMCTSIDGKVLSNRWGLAGATDLFETTAASFKIGAWVVGTTTMKEFSGHAQSLPAVRGKAPGGDYVARPKSKKLAIGADAKGVLRFQKNEVDGDHVVLLITSQTSAAYRDHLRRAGVSYLICGPTKIDLKMAMKKLGDAFNLKKLMLQGGGGFNGSMLRAGLVDEISHVLVPVVDGGGSEITGFFDAPGTPANSAAGKLRLIRHQTLPGGVHWFRWRVLGRG